MKRRKATIVFLAALPGVPILLLVVFMTGSSTWVDTHTGHEKVHTLVAGVPVWTALHDTPESSWLSNEFGISKRGAYIEVAFSGVFGLSWMSCCPPPNVDGIKNYRRDWESHPERRDEIERIIRVAYRDSTPQLLQVVESSPLPQGVSSSGTFFRYFYGQATTGPNFRLEKDER